MIRLAGHWLPRRQSSDAVAISTAPSMGRKLRAKVQPGRRGFALKAAMHWLHCVRRSSGHILCTMVVCRQPAVVARQPERHQAWLGALRVHGSRTRMGPPGSAVVPVRCMQRAPPRALDSAASWALWGPNREPLACMCTASSCCSAATTLPARADSRPHGPSRLCSRGHTRDTGCASSGIDGNVMSSSGGQMP